MAYFKKNNTKQSVGATLIELVMVILIIAILSIGVYTMWETTEFTLAGTINVIASDIRYTQTLSMARNSHYRFNLSNSAQYQVLNASGTAVTLPSNNSTTYTLPSNYTISNNLGISYLAFDAKGIPYSSSSASDNGNDTPITADLIITLTSDTGTTRQVTVTPETGRLSIS